MKIRPTVFAIHAAVLCAFALTQGCVTTESQGSGLGAGAKHKSPFRHQHKGKSGFATEGTAVATDPYEAYQTEEVYVYQETDIQETNSGMEPNTGASSYGQTEIYIVQKGDILSQLAVDFDTTTADLVEMNGLSNPDVLFVGQELSVPAGVSKYKTTTKSTGPIKKGGTYTIQKGDTLSGIAVAAGVAINDLRELNGINGDKIMAGEELDIPDYGSVPSTSRSASPPRSANSSTKTDTTGSSVTAPPPTAVYTADAPNTAGPATYEVVIDEVIYPGETLADKARQYSVSEADILRATGLTDKSQVKEGMTIRIPVAE